MADTTAPPPTAARPTPVWRRGWFPYVVLIALGALIGFGVAVRMVRGGALGSGERIGAWETGRDFATADQSARTRAVVAARGLLALPAAEARYYTARVDDAGQALAANCTYRLTGGAIPAQFWSVTLYDADGYLIANDQQRYSVGSAAMAPVEQQRWTIIVSPTPQPGRWLPSGTGNDPVSLTLRAYLPADGGQGNLTAAQLPTLRRERCA